MTASVHCVLTSKYLSLSLFRVKNLLKQTTKNGSHTTLRKDILKCSVMAERRCMLKCRIRNLLENILLERLPAHFHNAISMLERNKEICQDFPSCYHLHYLSVGFLYYPCDGLPRQKLCDTLCAQCTRQCNKIHH